MLKKSNLFVIFSIILQLIFSCSVNTESDSPEKQIIADHGLHVYYDGNGNDDGLVPKDNLSYDENSSAVVLDNSTMVKAGYFFMGWNTLPNGLGFNYSAGDAVAILDSNITLYAKWVNVLDNEVEMEISGINPGAFDDIKVIIIQGPGYNIERIYGFGSGKPNDSAGLATEYEFIFEADGGYAENIQAYFDQYTTPELMGARDGSIVIKDNGGTEMARWNFLEFIPVSYEDGMDARTRFTWRYRYGADTIVNWDFQSTYYFGNEVSCNPLVDKPVEIVGLGAMIYPEVKVDTVNRTITLLFDADEGNAIYPWVENFVNASDVDKRDMSVLERTDPLDPLTQTGGTNYYGIFPIQYQHYTGFSLPAKMKAKVVLSYDFSEYWDN